MLNKVRYVICGISVKNGCQAYLYRQSSSRCVTIGLVGTLAMAAAHPNLATENNQASTKTANPESKRLAATRRQTTLHQP